MKNLQHPDQSRDSQTPAVSPPAASDTPESTRYVECSYETRYRTEIWLRNQVCEQKHFETWTEAENELLRHHARLSRLPPGTHIEDIYDGDAPFRIVQVYNRRGGKREMQIRAYGISVKK